MTLLCITDTSFKDYKKCSHLWEAMISRRPSKLMRFIVNNLLLNLESPLVRLWRAPKLLEVHLPQFGNSDTYNMLFSVGPSFQIIAHKYFALPNNSSQSGNSCCLVLNLNICQFPDFIFLRMSKVLLFKWFAC